MHPSRTSGAPVAYSSTSVVFGSRHWIQMYVARHQNELVPVVNVALPRVCH